MESQHYAVAAPHDLEAGRLAELHALKLVDSPPQPEIDRLTTLVAQTFRVSKCWVSLVDDARQWFKSSVGLDVAETERSLSFCAHTINEPTGRLIIPDTAADRRFARNPLTLSLGIGCYAGIALRGPMGLPIGTLCIADAARRDFEAREIEMLEQFADLVSRELLTTVHLTRQATQSAISELAAPASGLPDRRAFTDVLSAVIGECPESEMNETHVLYIQIRHVHAVQQRFSNTGFEAFLRAIGERSLRETRASDFVAQNDHDSFLVLLRDCSPETAESVALRMHLAVQTTLEIDGEFVVPSIRSGACPVCANPEEAIANAILAADSITTTAGTMHRVFALNLAEAARRWHDLDISLRSAIDYQQLSVVYQPKVSIQSEALTGAEALLRWEHPELGPVRPDEFIAVAEESGFIVTLGRWVLEEACRQAAVWIEQDLLPGTIAVNVSPVQIQHPGFADDVRAILGATGLPPSRLELELTEQAFAENVDRLAGTMQELTDLGVSFALDDFGTGYSSLKYLAELPFKTLKIDRYFVSRAEDDVSIRAILRATVAIADPFKMRLVAEGIESRAQLKLLRKLSVHDGQGYLFAKPMSGEVFSQFAVDRQDWAPTVSAQAS